MVEAVVARIFAELEVDRSGPVSWWRDHLKSLRSFSINDGNGNDNDNATNEEFDWSSE